MDVAQPFFPQTLARPPLRPWLWALPFGLALVLVLAVLVALEASDRRDLEVLRRTLEADTLSLQDKLRTRLESEQLRLNALAAHFTADAVPPQKMATDPHLRRALHAHWVSMIWLGPNNRILAQLPVPPAEPVVGRGDNLPGVSVHLLAPLQYGGRDLGMLIARLQPTLLLKELTPWWMARRYDIRLSDDFDQVLATAPGTAWRTTASPLAHQISLAPLLKGTHLELSLREHFRPWYRSFPIWLLVGLLAMIGWASLLLRRQMREVGRAEMAWRTEAAWRKAMGESLRVGLRARDLQGRLLYVNRALGDMLGYSPEELVGHAPPMPYWEPEDMDEMQTLHLRTMAGQAPPEGFEARWRRRDGTALNVLIVEAPLIDAHGQKIGWMGSVLDITERLRAQVREQRQTEAMAYQARLTTLGEIASTLAHELNQPLAAIASYNAGLQNALKSRGMVDASIELALARQAEQTHQAASIVQRIRDFLSRREPHHEPCDLVAISGQAAQLLRRDLALRGVRLVPVPAAHAPCVVGDRVLLEQVMINLIRNAADALAMQSGAKTITLGLHTPSARFVRFDVCDNGPGLNGLGTEQLCQPFYSTKAEGMGMGLAICRSIIEAHYGTLDAADLPQGGARLSFSLPLAETAPPADAPTPKRSTHEP